MCGYFCTSFIEFTLAGKNLNDYTSLFIFMVLKKMIKQFWVIFKMSEVPTTHLNLSD